MTDQPFVDDFDGETYGELCEEISNDYAGETGALVRDHARAVLALRTLKIRHGQSAASDGRGGSHPVTERSTRE